jgi:hypothetical protein
MDVKNAQLDIILRIKNVLAVVQDAIRVTMKINALNVIHSFSWLMESAFILEIAKSMKTWSALNAITIVI